jgi:predicted DNA binding CopG/RHH family protein
MNRVGRPKSKNAKTEYLELRLTDTEKKGFKQCAAFAGIPFSTWVRERLRRAAIRELEEAGQRIPFLSGLE